MTATLDYFKLEITEPSALEWTDITADVGGLSFSRCEMTSDVTDRVTKVGDLTFTLNNSALNSQSTAGYYSDGAMLWIGAGVRLTYCYDDVDKVMWEGRIRGFQPTAGDYGERMVYVKAQDMIFELEKPFDMPVAATGKNMNDVIDLVIDNVGVTTNTPYVTDYTPNTTKTFARVFDTVKQRSTGIQEISKAVMSEFGHFMFVMDRQNGQTLKTQSRSDRTGGTKKKVPTAYDTGPLLELTNGNTLELTNGNDFVLRQQVDCDIPNANDMQVVWENLINSVRITVNPRKEDDAATTVLMSIDAPILLDQAGGPKDSTTIRLPYVDPDEKAVTVSATEMNTPVATTDYLSNTQEDGGGTDQTAKLTVAAQFGSNEAEITITNTHTADVYVTKLQARGKGIYVYAPYDIIRQNTDSISTYGLHEISFNMSYFGSYDEAEELAQTIVDTNYWPQADVKSVSYFANRSSLDMMRMLYIEPGDIINCSDTITNINQDFAVQGLRIDHDDGALYVTYNLKKLEADYA